MVKNLIKHGNSYAMIIDKPILDLLRIGPDTKLEITTNGRSILVSPVRDPEREARLRASLEAINAEHEADLKHLAE